MTFWYTAKKLADFCLDNVGNNFKCTHLNNLPFLEQSDLLFAVPSTSFGRITLRLNLVQLLG